jgi:3-oxoacyl-[acyl-carrier protein] reductase
VDLGLQNKTFVIGGGSKGLGGATARVLVEEGARVLLIAREATDLRAATARLGSNATFLVGDMADPALPAAVVAAVDRDFGGRLDGVLVNAGGPPGGSVFDLSDEQWLGAYQVLIGGPIRLLRSLVSKITDGGSILFITSSSTRQPITGLDTSNVLRPGVTALTKTLALQLAPRIRVNSLGPGRFDTDRVRWLDETRAKARAIPVEQQRAEASSQIPLGRYGDPAEFGRFAAFLLSPAASYVSGVNALADGALVTALP